MAQNSHRNASVVETSPLTQLGQRLLAGFEKTRQGKKRVK